MQNYSFMQKQLHRLVLGSQLIKRSLFDIETSLFYKNDIGINDQQHVFITGLPRSGTTILLEYLYKTGEFASLTYRDMPFVLSPNLFHKFSKKQDIPLSERMHQDGIKFDLNSPEAFDDVFFQTFDDKEIEENLKVFVSLVLKKNGKSRYLSKNNNNYSRVKLIQSVFPNAVIIMPYRDPIQHAYSLFRQHKHFCKLQQKDPFILEYMNFLGHHEFGSNHKSWYSPEEYKDPFSINYWLEQWFLFYQNIIAEKSHNSIALISYEELCEKSETSQNMIAKLNLSGFKYDNFFKQSQKNISEIYDKNLLSRCNDLKTILSSSTAF